MTTVSLRAAVLIISETASNDPSTDKCIPALKEVFDAEQTTQDGQDTKKWDLAFTEIVKDDVLSIQRVITSWTDHNENYGAPNNQPVNLIVTSGGTGFAKADVTPEAVRPLLHRHASGLVHGMLASSLSVTPFAMMARPVAGVRNETLIITLPGSPKGAKENLQAIIKLLPHACQQAVGLDSRTSHAGGTAKLEKDAGLRHSTALPYTHSYTHGHAHHHNHHHKHGYAVPKAHTTPADRPTSNDPSAGPTHRHRESPYPMLSVKEALEIIADNTPEPVPTRMSVGESLVGHVLAEDFPAKENVPAFRASIVDGYAIIASKHVMVPSTRGIFPVVSISHAKAGSIAELKIGEVARITTGAPLPAAATSVVMVEDTVLRKTTDDGKEEAEIEVLTDAIEPGENVREIGSDVAAGDIILRKGEGISAAGGELGLLASVGTDTVLAYRRPRVGVLSTGDEIINHNRSGPLRIGEVRDTNRPTLLTCVRANGFEAVDLGIASDAPGALETTLRGAMRQVDVIITSGGVSMGELDLLKPTIERKLGGTIHFGRVSMKPGKPTTFATIPFKDSDGKDVKSLIFSLPGNPASAVVTFNLFVLPCLHHFSGVKPAGLPKVKIVLDENVQCDEKRSEYHRVTIMAGNDGRLYASSTGGQRSSRIGSFRNANGLLCLPAQRGTIRKGETCDALLMAQLIGEA